jgi:hypothetical protein
MVDDAATEMVRRLGPDVLTLLVGGDQHLSPTALEPVLAELRPFVVFYWSRQVAKLGARGGAGAHDARDRALRAFDAASLKGLVVSFARASLEDAYLKSIHRDGASRRVEVAA